MAESVVRSCTSSANGVEKQRASRKSARAKQPAGRRGLLRAGESPLFAELARLAEMSLLERRLRSLGFRAIAGTDEVGRGCLAGPVVAAAVILPGEHFPGVNDSKLLSHAERVSRCHFILKHAVAVAIGIVEAHVIDQINILRASKAAMLHAVENLSTRPDVLLLDAVALDDLEMPQVPLIEGDRRSVSIAAASIVAKVYRDSLMQSYHEIYPRYNFINNRGYGTEDHWRALHEFGPTPIHRLSFQGVDEEMELFPG